jgi:cation diffusion facilitator CzcD-associated flavoprotein CzcO
MTWVFKSDRSRKISSDNHHQHATFPDVLANNDTDTPHVHIAILGTGFSGLGMAIRLKQRGYNDFVVIERADDIGGTWRDNTYPGCACDIPSLLYSFSFAPNPDWSRMYPPQREIQNYLRHSAKRFGILPHILWNNELQSAAWNDEDQRWQIATTQHQFTADILIMGYGPLCEPSLPSISGIESFEGTLFHTARWRHDYDLANKRVAVIGTGASAIQVVPQIQPLVAHLSLFQRTPPWIVPRGDHPITDWKHSLYRALPVTQRLTRTKLYWQHEFTALGLVYRSKVMNAAMRIARRHLEKQVTDPALRAKLTPHYEMGCKRILVSDDYYPALTRPNVEVISDRIREIRAHSIVTEDGLEHEVDAIICGTGFHVTDIQMPTRIQGNGGQLLADRWGEGASAYLGTTVSGFPNMFLLIGPNTGLGHNSMVFMIESQINYILSCLRTMQQRNLQAVDVLTQVQEGFDEELQRKMLNTVWTSGCASWYLDAKGHNTTLWPGFTFEFWRKTLRFDPQHYNLQPRSGTPREPIYRAHRSAQPDVSRT